MAQYTADAESHSRHKTQRHLPWWMYLAILSYVASFVFVIYLALWGPAELLGMVATFDDGMVIHSVEPGTEVAQAGLRAGDRIVMMNDLPIRTVRDWTAANGNSQAMRPERWLVWRGNERVTLEIVPTPKPFSTRLKQGYAQILSLVVTGYFLGFLIAWKRPVDPVARIGAWFIITASIAPGLPPGWAALWRALPAVLQFLLWFPQIGRFVLEGILLSFFVLFPRRIVRRPWVWIAIWVPVLVTLPWRFSVKSGCIAPG